MKDTRNIIGNTIPFANFFSEDETVQKEIETSIKRVLKSGWYLIGPELEEFETKLARYIGVKYAVGVASGTDALTIAIKSLGLKSSDAVLLPANVYPTVFGVALSGVKIRLCDVDPKSLNVTLETIKKAFTKDIKAIIIVHLYGNPVDIEPIKRFAKRKKVYLIEDCAQAIGAEYQDKKVGTFGDVGCFSFYPTKNLGAYGDGGAVVTNSKRLAERVKMWRMYGEKIRYDSQFVGLNSRLDEIQAAILKVKLKFLDDWNMRRRELAGVYRNELMKLPIEVVSETVGSKSIYHLFVIKTAKRDELSVFLKERNIGSGVHYPICVHLTEAFRGLGYKNGSFPVSEEAAKRVLSLPLYPQMTDETVIFVASALKEFFSR